jgi:thymidylate synthase (FAD)
MKQVLDRGFVKLVDFVGGDSRVIECARVSRGGTTRGDSRDRKLLSFLIKNDHLTPFETSIFAMHVKCPIFVARQWMRHRWGVFNELSGRYAEFNINDYYVPEELFTQSKLEKHSTTRANFSFLEKKEIYELIKYANAVSATTYKKLLELGLAKEQARIILPLSMYTEFYWTVHARALMHFLELRLSEHAQYEIRQYASVVCDYFQEKMPWTYEDFYYKKLYKPV